MAARRPGRTPQRAKPVERVGAECAGAVQILPEGAVPGTGHVRRLSEREVATLIADLPTYHLPDGATPQASLAGIHDKALLVALPDGGWGWPESGAPSTHIIKPEPLTGAPPHLSEVLVDQHHRVSRVDASIAGQTRQHRACFGQRMPAEPEMSALRPLRDHGVVGDADWAHGWPRRRGNRSTRRGRRRSRREQRVRPREREPVVRAQSVSSTYSSRRTAATSSGMTNSLPTTVSRRRNISVSCWTTYASMATPGCRAELAGVTAQPRPASPISGPSTLGRKGETKVVYNEKHYAG